MIKIQSPSCEASVQNYKLVSENSRSAVLAEIPKVLDALTSVAIEPSGPVIVPSKEPVDDKAEKGAETKKDSTQEAIELVLGMGTLRLKGRANVIGAKLGMLKACGEDDKKAAEQAIKEEKRLDDVFNAEIDGLEAKAPKRGLFGKLIDKIKS